MSDHRALIAEAQEQDLERRFGSWQDEDLNADGTEPDPIENIVTDAFALIARLADALEQQAAELKLQGGISASIFRDLVGRESEVSAAIDRSEAAERRAASLEREGEEWRVLYYDGQLERAKLEEELSAAERRAAELRAQNESLLARLATEREQHREMYERQAAAVRHHTDRAATLARDLAAAEHARDQYQAEFSRTVDLLHSTERDLAAARQERDELRAAIDAAWATTQAALAPSPQEVPA